MVTKLEILDTAIKIGLGAVISGVATYRLAKANHEKTIEKERAQRRRDMLEVVAQQVANFHQLALAHWGFAINWIAFSDNSETSETARTELQKRHKDLSNGYAELTSAETTLLLLGEKSCHQALREYGLAVKLYKTDRIVAREFSKEKLDKYKEQLETTREKFFSRTHPNIQECLKLP